MSESTYRMPLLYVLFFTSRMKRELLHPPHPSSDRTTGVLIWSLPPHVLMRHVRLRVEHVVSSREARDHAHYSHDDCSLLHRRTPPMVRTTTQLTTRVVDDLGADDDDSVDWTGYSAEEDEVLEGCADKIADKDDDLNCTAPGEDTAQYGATDSGDKAALDDIDTGKEAAIIPKVLEVDEATYAPDAAALKIAHEIRFEEQFLENIGGKEAGWLETPGQDLRKMSLNVWEDIEQPSTFDYMQSPLCPSNCGDRFQQISQNLHFNPHNHAMTKQDKSLEDSNAVLPSHSSLNKMRVFLKDKPHKWGTLLFMLCSAMSA
ncbi:hypothetical protein PC110_g20585 [Phytophthora cactorum]|uniref:Uncharacterized protein n=1 Tax=Phytophthora cactorum TaxID=29920 RepID=A0A329RFW9_9STRA|nr:hypothetical protein PC110_g20585 [Phytophthora cactorum]